MNVDSMSPKWNNCEHKSAEQSIFMEARGISDASRDPEWLPRVGDEYQAEIPSLLQKSAYILHTESASSTHNFLAGLPICTMWINEEGNNSKHEQWQVPGDDTHISNSNSSPMSEGMREMQDGGKGNCMVPGSLGNTLSAVEGDSFLLGLYIFGKNFAQVKKFVGTKGIGDILSFYYGKFSRSERFRRWLECHKKRSRSRSRRSKYGDWIFTGLRQQELLSRLLPQVSEESQKTLLEVAKIFRDGKILLEDYVFSLKAIVGLNAFVEAVGIGKGKEDLTRIGTVSPKSNQVAHVLPVIPTGKACSNLTTLEVLTFLTGGYRLSKTQSNDLFWEAVWPCLLERGWQSKQPDNYAASRNPLVFLVPGVTNFSRGRLVKGKDYFDSVSDVLNMVASNPALVEVDNGANNGDRNNQENGWANGTNVDQEGLPHQQQHCHLKPRTPTCSANVVKLTIVDTSLANGETSKVSELRLLPVEMMSISTSRNDFKENGGPSKECRYDIDAAIPLSFDGNNTDIDKSTNINFAEGLSSYESNALRQSVPVLSFFRVPLWIRGDPKENESNDMQPREAVGHATWRRSPGENILAPLPGGQQRLVACDREETSCSTINALVDPRLQQEEADGTAGNPIFRDNILSNVDQPSTNSSRGAPNISNGYTQNTSAERPHEKRPPGLVIDLNLPIPEDAEAEPLMMETTQTLHGVTSKQPEDLCMLNTSAPACDSTPEQPHSMDSHRHSTRNRPPTTRALEALAFGYLDVRQKRKKRSCFELESSISRPFQRPRSRLRITDNAGTSTMDPKGDEKGNGVQEER